MMKINFKQPKYIFPLVVFIPLCALVYFVMQTFGGGSECNLQIFLCLFLEKLNMPQNTPVTKAS